MAQVDLILIVYIGPVAAFSRVRHSLTTWSWSSQNRMTTWQMSISNSSAVWSSSCPFSSSEIVQSYGTGQSKKVDIMMVVMVLSSFSLDGAKHGPYCFDTVWLHGPGSLHFNVIPYFAQRFFPLIHSSFRYKIFVFHILFVSKSPNYSSCPSL